MNPRLLAVKFHKPLWRAASILRPRLLQKLSLGLDEQRKISLVSAPAGYGKTTLVSGWIAALDRVHRQIAWLSIDAADNDPERFFAYLWAACRPPLEGVATRFAPILNLHSPSAVNALLDDLINTLAARQTPLLLILDDYHLITNPTVHQAMEYFIHHQPSNVHLVIITRQDPPLPLARLRARAQLTEIRAHDLRFTPQESRLFFLQSMQLHLTDDLVQALEERAEGWAVGLRLAGLALQNASSIQKFIETFRGSHRYILDYLAEEVIRQQGEDVRSFLIQTSVADRFNAGLCRALTGRADAAKAIAELEQNNLFIVPLDDEGIWYRYHHLFSDYLRSLLSAPEQTALYKKASAWHMAQDFPQEAVQYALASRETGFIADAIEQAFTRDAAWSNGNLRLLSSWVEAVPPIEIERRPKLSLNTARVLYLSGKLDMAETRLVQTEQTLAAMPTTPEREDVKTLATLYHASIASARGQAQQAIDLISSAQARLPAENRLAHARAYFDLGLAYEMNGQSGRAVQYYELSSTAAESAEVLFLAVTARCSAAQALITQGRLTQAEQTCRTAIKITHGAAIPPIGLAWIVLGGIALERNQMAEAETALRDGVALAQQGGLFEDAVAGLLLLGRWRAAQGQAADALAAHQQAASMIRAYGLARLDERSAAELARLHLLISPEQAAAWAKEYQRRRSATPNEFEELTLARVWLAQAKPEGLPALLHPILEKAQADGRLQTSMEAMLLLALTSQAQQDRPSAATWLEKALRLAAPEGAVRIFLDAGRPLLDLLPYTHQAAPALVDALLQAGPPSPPPSPNPNLCLPNPLSEQELRVLAYILAGKSNQEIATELVISVGTAKWHVHHIFQKLGVNNRPQAIARAAQLGL